MSEKNNDCAERVIEQEEEVEDMAAKRVEDKVSIEQILEGMTNEFNRSVVNPAKITDIEKTDSPTGKIDSDDSKDNTEITEKNSGSQENCEEKKIELDESKDENAVETSQDVAKDESADVEEQEKLGKQENVKKDNNIPRIVLTFRTMNENTDYGRKTKISSCSSNLSLVPDELGNCDQIGGVSVKIEHSDDNSDHAEKSDNEEGKNDEEGKIEEKPKETEKIEEKTPEAEVEKTEESQHTESKEEEKNKKPVANDNIDVESVPETAKQLEPEPPVTRKRRAVRARLRVAR